MLYEQVLEAAAAIQMRCPHQPAIAIILGSGQGDLASEMADAVSIPYTEIPHFARSTVPGHAGHLHIGMLEGVHVVMMQGRFHLYEGYAPQVVTFPVRVMHHLGARTLIVSNAAGGVNPTYRPGDFMLINDHIYLPGLAGTHPLVGPNDERFGERFPALAFAYDAELRSLAHMVADEVMDMTLHDGVYTMAMGPSFETMSELKFLRLIGTDAVGMSTVPEVIVARHMGMRVLGMSLISNAATGSESSAASHSEVLTTANAARLKFALLVRGIVRKLASQ